MITIEVDHGTTQTVLHDANPAVLAGFADMAKNLAAGIGGTFTVTDPRQRVDIPYSEIDEVRIFWTRK